MYHYYVDQITDAGGYFDGESGVVLQWTTEPPTQEGMYRAIMRGNKRAYWAEVWKIQDGMFGLVGDDNHGIGDFTHWLGPLPVPAPPKE